MNSVSKVLTIHVVPKNINREQRFPRFSKVSQLIKCDRLKWTIKHKQSGSQMSKKSKPLLVARCHIQNCELPRFEKLSGQLHNTNLWFRQWAPQDLISSLRAPKHCQGSVRK